MALLLWQMAVICPGQTIITGPYVFGHWTSGGSPYQVMADITIPPDTALIIDSGVEVIFFGYYSLTINGRIEANGATGDSVLFAPVSTATPWNGLRFLSATGQSALSYCVFTHSDSDYIWGGGAIYLTASRVDIGHCLFLHNTTTEHTSYTYQHGGAICLEYNYDKASITNCVFENNTCTGPIADGGAICAAYSSPPIQNCSFINNSAERYGGAILLYVTGQSVISNCLFLDNTGGPEGNGAIGALLDCDPVIRDCEFNGNATSGPGGAMGFYDNCDPLIENCLIINNIASGEGGGIMFSGSAGSIKSSTISNNEADNGGGVAFNSSAGVESTNTIIWGNDATVGPQVYLGTEEDDPGFTYCDIEGGSENFGGPGAATYNGTYEHNINSPPLFRDPENGDFHLTWASFPVVDSTMSECIDSGGPPDFCTDPDGTVCDMGLYYFDQWPDTPLALEATNVYITGFQANWRSARGALGYFIDVAWDDGFYGFIEGYENFNAGNDTSLQVTIQELADTICYYRLRAYNTNVTGDNSNVISVALGMASLPEIPRELPLSMVNTANGVRIRTLDPGILPYTLQLYNILGQLIISLQVDGETVFVPLNIPGQVVVLRCVSGNRSRSWRLATRDL